MLFAHVIVDSRNPETDRMFDYIVPEQWREEIAVGQRVMVPFGRRNAGTEGYVISLAEESQVLAEKLKAISEILDEGKPVFTPVLLELAFWMKETYFCTLNQCLQAIMPPGIRTKSQWFVELAPGEETELTPKEESFLAFLRERGGVMPLQEAEESWEGRLQPVLKGLREKGCVALRQKIRRGEYKKEKKYYWPCEDSECWQAAKEQARKDRRLAARLRVMEALEQTAPLSLEELKERAMATDSPIRTLAEKGILREERQQEKRNVFSLEDYEKTTAFVPTKEQAEVLAAMEAERKKEKKRPVLLHGITGSGKTEVYMQMIAQVIAEGKQAVVLVPEISLTPLIMERFISRFGQAVSVTHSRLSTGERLDQWRKARDGEISVMIGPRSALFTPFENVGIIVMDECHETSYDSDITPKYHTVDVARKLAEVTGALLVLGSATPDIVTYHRAVTGEFLLLELKERTKGSLLPAITVADMRRELEEGNRSPFSRELAEAIGENLRKKEQTMLFLNRRGYATFVSCRKCGEAMVCPECNITYTYHAREQALMCHYCGRQVPVPKVCPSCGSSYIRYFGTGTQKIEEEVCRLYPEARVLRMDLDTTMTKNSHARILELFGSGRADILVGTQMIAKGHDFPNVTLVGILAADASLRSGDYTAAENCFQLLTQAAGRAGRDSLPGRVIIQTYEPDNYAVAMAAAQDYKGFYEEEIKMRQAMEYPPFAHLFSVLVTGEKEEEVIQAANYLGALMRHYSQKAETTVLGPSPAALPKFRGEYRWRILAKGVDGKRLAAYGAYCVERAKKEAGRQVYFHMAFDPRNIV